MSEKMTQAIDQIESAVATIEIELAYIEAAIAKLRKVAKMMPRLRQYPPWYATHGLKGPPHEQEAES